MRGESASGWDLQERQKTHQQMRFSGSDEADFHWVLTQTLKESRGSFYSQVMKYSPRVEWIINPVLLAFAQTLSQCFVSLSIYCHNRTRNETQLIICWHGGYITNSVVRGPMEEVSQDAARSIKNDDDIFWHVCMCSWQVSDESSLFPNQSPLRVSPASLGNQYKCVDFNGFWLLYFLTDCAINGFPRQWTHETPLPFQLPTKPLSLSPICQPPQRAAFPSPFILSLIHPSRGGIRTGAIDLERAVSGRLTVETSASPDTKHYNRQGDKQDHNYGFVTVGTSEGLYILIPQKYLVMSGLHSSIWNIS